MDKAPDLWSFFLLVLHQIKGQKATERSLFEMGGFRQYSGSNGYPDP